jgi:sulfur relay (sulfurtransferase) DsrF/TusC family protein
MTKEEKTKSDETVDPRTLHNKLLLQWKAPEFIIHQRGKKWFLIMGVITLLLVIYALATNSATMAIVFIVLAGVYYLTHNQDPKIIDIKITELGIYVGDTFYPYNMINAYWIIYNPPYVHSLNLRLSNKTFTKVVIQLDVQDPVAVRKMLAKEIPEIEGEDESMSEILIRLLRL